MKRGYQNSVISINTKHHNKNLFSETISYRTKRTTHITY